MSRSPVSSGRVVTTVSLDPKLMADGRARAESIRYSFSRYLETLIARDLRVVKDAKEAKP